MTKKHEFLSITPLFRFAFYYTLLIDFVNCWMKKRRLFSPGNVDSSRLELDSSADPWYFDVHMYHLHKTSTRNGLIECAQMA